MKAILDRGKHPVFVGEDMTSRLALNGGLLFVVWSGQDIATALVNPRLNSLLVLNVDPAHRSHGIGAATVRFLKINFVRAIEDAAPFFERLGYQRIGQLKKGRRFKTQIMVRKSLIGISGRLEKIYGISRKVSLQKS